MWKEPSVVGWCAIICVNATGLAVPYDIVTENLGVVIGVAVRHRKVSREEHNLCAHGVGFIPGLQKHKKKLAAEAS